MNGRLHVRIDNRLLHGQVVQFWIPHLDIKRLIVADDQVATNEALLTIYRMSVPKSVDIIVTPVSRLSAELAKRYHATTMVLICDINDVTRAMSFGTSFNRLTLGNVHAATERTRITNSVYLSEKEMSTLADFHHRGIQIEIQTLPNEILYLNANDAGDVRWLRP